jgi:hypothetical protein
MLYDYSAVYDGLNITVDYIHSLLARVPDQNLIADASESFEKIELEGRLEDLQFDEIDDDSDRSVRSAAIDGGQGRVVANSVFNCSVYRAGLVVFEGCERSHENISELELVNLNPANYQSLYAEKYLKLYNCYPSDWPTFSECLSALRHLKENSCLENAIDSLNQGDLLLLDGSLRAGDESEHSFLIQLLDQASKKGIDIVAVSKASALLWKGGASMTGVISKLGNQKFKDKCWSVKIGSDYPQKPEMRIKDLYIAKLNPYSRQAFRIDLSVRNRRKAGEIFKDLGFLSSDPFFTGYPYPLAAVHQAVRLSEDELLGLRTHLWQIAVKAGISEDEWELLFEDYHDTLNYDVSRTGFIL